MGKFNNAQNVYCPLLCFLKTAYFRRHVVSINNDINLLLKNEEVDYIGYARLDGYQKELFQFGGPIVLGYSVGISIGIALPDSIVDHLPRRNDSNVACEYKYHCYDVINQRLNLIASKLASFLNRKGHRTLPIVSAVRTNEEDAMPTLSHKMIAHIAGLGWIGKNCLLITPHHGPRVRFITVLTNAPLDAKDEPLKQQCNNCMECVKICPAQAIKGINYETGKPREDRFDFIKCHDYFIAMKNRTKWDVCGMCLYVCPFGKTGKSH
jgi:epoxyqueuosine reductase